MPYADIARTLVEKDTRLFEAPKQFVQFTKDKEADTLLNDLERFPHAFVLACVMDRQIRAERAWLIPYRFAQQLGDFQFSTLRKLSVQQIRTHMTTPEPLHRFVEEMRISFHAAIELIEVKYKSNAANLWAEILMAANILARDFKIPLRDYYSIDISADVQVRRVFERLGLTAPGSSVEQVIYRARALHPEFPGLLDFPAWEVDRNWCRPSAPNCPECYMHEVCPFAVRRPLGAG